MASVVFLNNLAVVCLVCYRRSDDGGWYLFNLLKVRDGRV